MVLTQPVLWFLFLTADASLFQSIFDAQAVQVPKGVTKTPPPAASGIFNMEELSKGKPSDSKLPKSISKEFIEEVPRFEIPDQKAPEKKIDPKKEPKVKAEFRVTENEALLLAALDLKTLSIEDQLFTRYIWVTDASLESMQAVSLTMNYVSRGPVLIRPLPLGKDKLMVLRLNLRNYAPKPEDIADMAKVWEEFQFDPRFNLLITKDTLKFALGEVQGKNVKTTKIVPVMGDKDDPKFVKKEVEGPLGLKSFDDAQLIRVVSEHIDKSLVAYLVDATQSQAPMVSHRYFITRALSAIEDDGVYKIIYGGLYYKLAGIKKGFKQGSDEDNFLESLGIGNVKDGVTAKKLFDNLRSDQRTAVFRSGITGRPRRIDVFRSLVARIDGSQSLVSFTHDLRAQDIDVGTHPIMNLLDFKDAAREVIYEKQNGLHGFVLFDGKGALQNEVPPDIAADHMIPPPHGTRLEPAIGCIRCHGSDGGWKVVHNDVKKLLGGYIDAFGDLSKNAASDAVNRLAGLYAGDLELKTLPRGRDDYASNILRATGPFKNSKDQTDIVKLSAEKLSDIYRSYRYDLVHAVDVLADMGFVVERKDAAKRLREIIPVPSVRIEGIIPEDPRIAALFMDLQINRVEYDLIYSFLVTRAKK